MRSPAVLLIVLMLGAALWAAARARAAAWRSGDFLRLERKLDALSALLRDYYTEGSGGAKAESPELPDSHGFGHDHPVTRADLRRLERKLDTIVRGLGVQDSLWPPASQRVRLLWSEGQRVEAIRAYRIEQPALGLREAKEILEWTLGRS